MKDNRKVDQWLDAYKRAWEHQDADLVAGLFTETARYAINPLENILRGRQEIKSYWASGAAGSQQDISFDYEVWAVAEDMTIAHWTASFTRAAAREIVKMDGVFRLVFAQGGGKLLCDTLEEWWFLKADAL